MRLVFSLLFFSFTALSLASLPRALPDLTSLESASNLEFFSSMSAQETLYRDIYSMIRTENAWTLAYFGSIFCAFLAFLFGNWIAASFIILFMVATVLGSLCSDHH